MMMALLHSNGQLRTERDGDREKGCENTSVQQKITDDDYQKVTFSMCMHVLRYWSMDVLIVHVQCCSNCLSS